MTEIPLRIHVIRDRPLQFQQLLDGAAHTDGVVKGPSVLVGVRELVPQLPNPPEMLLQPPPRFTEVPGASERRHRPRHVQSGPEPSPPSRAMLRSLIHQADAA